MTIPYYSITPAVAVVVPFSGQQVSQLKEGLVSALCVPLLEASNIPDQCDSVERAYQEHALNQPNMVVAVGETYRLTDEENLYRCHYLDGESWVFPKHWYGPDELTVEQVSGQWQDPATLPLMFCRFFFFVATVRISRISHVCREDNLEQMGLIDPVEPLVCHDKFCGNNSISGYKGPEQNPTSYQNLKTDYSFELAFRQYWSSQYGQQSLDRDDFLLWVEFESAA